AVGWLRPRSLTGNPSPFDPDRYWRSRGVAAPMTATTDRDLALGPPPFRPLTLIERAMRPLQTSLGNLLDRRLAPDAAPLGRALLLGQPERLDDARREAFR